MDDNRPTWKNIYKYSFPDVSLTLYFRQHLPYECVREITQEKRQRIGKEQEQAGRKKQLVRPNRPGRCLAEGPRGINFRAVLSNLWEKHENQSPQTLASVAYD